MLEHDRDRFSTSLQQLLRRRSSPAARRAPASPRRSTPRCCRSPRARRRSSRSRTRSSTASTGIRQVQVNEKTGMTFATGLRSMMRADPDIVMVGEIRDARVRAHRRRGRADRPPRALHAAHQRRPERGQPPDRHGHRAVPRRLGGRLRRRPAPRAQALRASCKQRPRRRTCRGTFEPVGCARCGNTGYKGRVGLFEVMTVTSEMHHLIVERASVEADDELASRPGHARLRDDGMDEGPRRHHLDGRGRARRRRRLGHGTGSSRREPWRPPTVMLSTRGCAGHRGAGRAEDREADAVAGAEAVADRPELDAVPPRAGPMVAGCAGRSARRAGRSRRSPGRAASARVDRAGSRC